MVLCGLCCDEAAAPFLETASDTKKGAHQHGRIERANVSREFEKFRLHTFMTYQRLMSPNKHFSINFNYRNFRKQFNVLDANTFTIKRAVCRPAIILHGLCCNEDVHF